MNSHLFLTKRKTKQFQQPPPSSTACFTPLKMTHKPVSATNFSTFKEDSSFKFMDSVEVDYRQKCFQYMKKNTQLQLSMKQSKNDIENLQKQVQNFKEIVIEFAKIFKGEQTPNTFNTQQITSDKIIQMKNSLSNLMKKQQPFSNERAASHISLSQSLCQISTSQSRGIINENRKDPDQHNCECESHYSGIINEYKSIMQMQHSNIQKKQKSNKLLKKQVQTYKQILSDIKKHNQQNDQNISQLQQKLNQNKQETQQLKNTIDQLRQKLKNSQQKIRQLQSKLQEKEEMIVKLTVSNQQVYREKQKIKTKYKQQIVHFQEMEKLVEEKLIQVQYQMNFYKKQRVENFSKIRKLQAQLKQYKTNEEKKYYSFGESHKDVSIQTSPTDFMEESQAQIIISMDKTVTVKQNKTEKIAKKTSIQEHINKQLPIREELENSLQMKCYEQSIKTLLLENDRLKKFLLQVYRSKKSPELQLDQQIEMQLKILLSLGQETQQQSQIYENSKKGRRFIKQV